MAAPLSDRYEYEFRTITFGGFLRAPQEDYQQIVEDYAERGWRLLQILVIPTTEGSPRTMELIFERAYRGVQDRTQADRPKFGSEPLFEQPKGL